MKQEHLFSNFFRMIYPLIDKSKLCLFCLDGEAAKAAAVRGELDYKSPPGLVFALIGSQSCSLVEVKIVDRDKVSITKGQAKEWNSIRCCPLAPRYWIGQKVDGSKYYYWNMFGFQNAIDNIGPYNGSRTIRPANVPVDHWSWKDFDSIEELSLYCLKSF